ncbi:MAG: hypothetical protein KKH04_14850 [Proteobacteria bacterium]|nr:hypothetical protein [Pseudomonadota bacterium]
MDVDYFLSLPSMKRKYPDHPIIGVGGIVFHEDQILLARLEKGGPLLEESVLPSKPTGEASRILMLDGLMSLPKGLW